MTLPDNEKLPVLRRRDRSLQASSQLCLPLPQQKTKNVSFNLQSAAVPSCYVHAEVWYYYILLVILFICKGRWGKCRIEGDKEEEEVKERKCRVECERQEDGENQGQGVIGGTIKSY